MFLKQNPCHHYRAFQGADLLVMLDLNGVFIDVQLIAHNEPIFVSGLGEAAFHNFLNSIQGYL